MTKLLTSESSELASYEFFFVCLRHRQVCHEAATLTANLVSGLAGYVPGYTLVAVAGHAVSMLSMWRSKVWPLLMVFAVVIYDRSPTRQRPCGRRGQVLLTMRRLTVQCVGNRHSI